MRRGHIPGHLGDGRKWEKSFQVEHLNSRKTVQEVATKNDHKIVVIHAVSRVRLPHRLMSVPKARIENYRFGQILIPRERIACISMSWAHMTLKTSQLIWANLSTVNLAPNQGFRFLQAHLLSNELGSSRDFIYHYWKSPGNNSLARAAKDLDSRDENVTARVRSHGLNSRKKFDSALIPPLASHLGRDKYVTNQNYLWVYGPQECILCNLSFSTMKDILEDLPRPQLVYTGMQHRESAFPAKA
ncbi:hypothetical protein DFH06DRAFT_1151201 [Mycena polygramma]|nr:hypothetical protein DFH06DRAFT_1151201 [Mycena polygramma]